MGDSYRRDDYEFRIWLKTNGFQLKVKKRGDNSYWPEIAPIIPPP